MHVADDIVLVELVTRIFKLVTGKKNLRECGSYIKPADPINTS
jgi:hypothetical protein